MKIASTFWLVHLIANQMPQIYIGEDLGLKFSTLEYYSFFKAS